MYPCVDAASSVSCHPEPRHQWVEGEGDPTALEFEVHALFPFRTARQEQGCGVEEGIPVWTRRVEAWTKQGGQPIQP